MKFINYVSLLMPAVMSLTGCASLTMKVADIESRVRNTYHAQKAWNECSWCYDELDHPFHFSRGFKAGYGSVIEGGNGCQPTLPPRRYWMPRFQSAKGRSKINAWFDGYSHGALAAQQDGAGSWHEIPLSPTARMNLQVATAEPDTSGAADRKMRSPVVVPPEVMADAGAVDSARLSVGPEDEELQLRINNSRTSPGSRSESPAESVQPYE
ncbi:MAG: hypothetical protein MK110_07775 [Fuerstiella sp.]|nr:hypothetical protein [Fuerstiella sp.]